MQQELGFIVTKENRKIDYTSSAKRLKLKPVEFMSYDELINTPPGEVFIFDVECYHNFFYVAFKCLSTGKYVAFERSPDFDFNPDALSWVLWRFCIVGFNSRNYDLPIISLALKGATCEELKQATDFIIKFNNTPWAFEKQYGLKIQKYNHIDIIEVAPLQGSLKLYAGRLHCKTMQDLPLPPEHVLTKEDADILRPYCCNDLDNTQLLFEKLAPEIKLRIEMSEEYGVDLRSKSDAQIAEAVLGSELKKVLGYYPKKPNFDENEILMYNVPDFIEFNSPHLKEMLETVQDARFQLDGGGSPVWPEGLGEYVKTKSGRKWQLSVRIGKSVYKLGMGGLHSQEKKVAYIADENTYNRDNDAESFYPRIILNQGLFPPHLGDSFLSVYETIVNRRLEAKKQGHKAVSDSLKIVINGSFGKLGSKYSILYAPQLMLQVTITGQLALLMLIEMLEEKGITCVSGNTDGVVSMYDKSRHDEVRGIIKQWEEKTAFKTEETEYAAVYSRDVNNYIAVKKDGVKKKGTFAQDSLAKNPEHNICTDGVIAYLTEGKSVEKTIKECKDVRRFVSVRNVKGGGEKDGVYLGKVVRWYYAKGETGCIKYVGSGNKVAKTDGAKPLMDLPDELPSDVDYNWYIKTATDMLFDCGSMRHPESGVLFDF